METQPQPQGLSFQRFAEELDVSKRLVQDWVATGKVRAVTLSQGKRKSLRRIPRSELERVLAKGLQ